MHPKNAIELDKDGNVIFRDPEKGDVHFDKDKRIELVKKLNQLDANQIKVLLELMDEQIEDISPKFAFLLNKVATQKNIIRGDISNVGSVNVGDHIHYHTNSDSVKISKELSTNIPRINVKDIIGRDADLEELHRLLNVEKKHVAIGGVGGIGKTTLAQAYLFQYYDQYEHILWITQNSINITYDVIDTPGLVKNLSVEVDELDAQQLFQEIARKLKEIADKPNLLIIDNADSAMKTHLNFLPAQPSWHLLLTSREEISGVHLYDLDFLEERIAIDLFKKHYTHKHITEEDIEELILLVDRHTLTIEILAKTAEEFRYGMNDLRSAIAKNLESNLEVNHNKLNVETRIASYLCAVFDLSKQNDAEIWVMKQFACLPADFHSYDLLEELLVTDNHQYRTTLPRILSSLVKKGWLFNNKASDSYKMHRIIVEVIKTEIKIVFEDVETLVNHILKNIDPGEIKDNPATKFIWIPFAKEIISIFKNDLFWQIEIIKNNLAMLLNELGDFVSAGKLQMEIVHLVSENFGRHHVSSAMAYVNLASTLSNMGQNQMAKEYTELAIKISKDNFGKDHPTTGGYYQILASILRALNRDDEAKELLEKVVKINEREFGHDHPKTIISRTNLTLVLSDLKHISDSTALLELENTINSSEKYFGKEHPNTAVAYRSFANHLNKLGRYTEAKVFFEKALTSNERNFGRYHKSTADSYLSLSVVSYDEKDYQQSLAISNIVVAIYDQIFSSNHPDVVKLNKWVELIKSKIT